jgi:dihydroflavonol-4-reductase
MTVATDSSQPTVDIRDVAEAALLAEQYGLAGERYIIANEYISNREFYTMATAECGNPPPRFVPLWLAACVAWFAERYFKITGRKDYLLSSDAVFLSNAFKAMDNSKARKELHWQPRPIGETIGDAVAWFAAHEVRD